MGPITVRIWYTKSIQGQTFLRNVMNDFSLLLNFRFLEVDSAENSFDNLTASFSLNRSEVESIVETVESNEIIEDLGLTLEIGTVSSQDMVRIL